MNRTFIEPSVVRRFAALTVILGVGMVAASGDASGLQLVVLSAGALAVLVGASHGICVYLNRAISTLREESRK